MPTKKQRRRREKDRRHEYEYVYVDDEGHEVEVDEPAPEPKPARAASGTTKATSTAKPKPGAKKPAGRAARVPQEPSWSRSAKRALPWQGVMVVLVLLLFRKEPVATRLFFALIYAVAFIPF